MPCARKSASDQSALRRSCLLLRCGSTAPRASQSRRPRRCAACLASRAGIDHLARKTSRHVPARSQHAVAPAISIARRHHCRMFAILALPFVGQSCRSHGPTTRFLRADNMRRPAFNQRRRRRHSAGQRGEMAALSCGVRRPAVTAKSTSVTWKIGVGIREPAPIAEIGVGKPAVRGGAQQARAAPLGPLEIMRRGAPAIIVDRKGATRDSRALLSAWYATLRQLSAAIAKPSTRIAPA